MRFFEKNLNQKLKSETTHKYWDDEKRIFFKMLLYILQQLNFLLNSNLPENTIDFFIAQSPCKWKEKLEIKLLVLQ